MKAKRFGLVSIFVLLFSAIGTAGFMAWQILDPARAVALGDKPAMGAKEVSITIPPIDTASLQTIRTRQPEIDQLRIPASAVQGNVNMEMLGYSGQSIASDQAIANRPDEDLSAHVVSMAFVSGTERFAVIDGEMYQEGDDLKGEEGTKVRNITTEKVLIAGRSVRQWVKVTNPVTVAKKKKEEKKEEAKVSVASTTTGTAKAPASGAAPAPAAMGNLGEALQTLKNYSDAMNTLKGAQ